MAPREWMTSRKEGSYNPLLQLVLARVWEFWRQPEAVFWVYGFPLIMMVALGIAFRNRPVENFEVDVVAGPRAADVREALRDDERFVVHILELEEARARLRTGRTDLVVAARPSSTAAYHYYYDPTRPGSLLVRNAADERLQQQAGREDVVPTRDHEIEEPGGRYIDFLVPGLIGMGLMGGGLWGVGFATVDLRIRKLLKRYVATPMKRSHFLGAMMISRLIFTVSETFLLLLFARYIFGVENYGSYVLLGLLVLLGAFEFAGIGLLVASRAQTLETVSGLMNLVMLPMWIASGVFYSIERFPEGIQPALRLLPLTPLIDALRAVMQEGQGAAALGFEVTVCLLWGGVTFLLALKWFRWS